MAMADVPASEVPPDGGADHAPEAESPHDELSTGGGVEEVEEAEGMTEDQEQTVQYRESDTELQVAEREARPTDSSNKDQNRRILTPHTSNEDAPPRKASRVSDILWTLVSFWSRPRWPASLQKG